jgi:hypothetical protein
MGDIIAKAVMPSSKFTNPINFSTIPANTPFLAQIAVQNMDTGFFTNAQQKYVVFSNLWHNYPMAFAELDSDMTLAVTMLHLSNSTRRASWSRTRSKTPPLSH